jgi:hypothetical protein
MTISGNGNQISDNQKNKNRQPTHHTTQRRHTAFAIEGLQNFVPAKSKVWCGVWWQTNS